MAEKLPPKKRHRTIKSLRLDLESARQGRTWLLLPEGFRDQEAGKTYPLPTGKSGIQELACISMPVGKRDSGCIYLRRALKETKLRWQRHEPSSLAIERHELRMKSKAHDVGKEANQLIRDARKAVENVKEEAERAGASLKDLFSLGRKGLKGQMEAHLANEPWNGEQISAQAFRQAFSMVTQAVKGLGMPSDQKSSAKDAIISEVAEALRDTQETVGLAAGNDDETEH